MFPNVLLKEINGWIKFREILTVTKERGSVFEGGGVLDGNKFIKWIGEKMMKQEII